MAVTPGVPAPGASRTAFHLDDPSDSESERNSQSPQLQFDKTEQHLSHLQNGVELAHGQQAECSPPAMVSITTQGLAQMQAVLSSSERILGAGPLKSTFGSDVTTTVDIKRTLSDPSVNKFAHKVRPFPHDPRDWIPGYMSSNLPSQTHVTQVNSMFNDTAGTFGVQRAEDMPRIMKDAGISPWAAVLALSTPTIVEGPPMQRNHSRSIRTNANTSSTEHLDQLPEDIRADALPLNVRSASGSDRNARISSGARDVKPDDEDMEDEENMKRNFIMKLGRTFSMYGAPSHRLEYHMNQVAEALNVEADFLQFPNLILISFGGTETYKSTTHFLKAPWGINMGKLAQVNALCLALTEGLIDIHNAVDLLEGVRAGKDYPDWMFVLTFPVSSFCATVLLFQLTWLEGGVSAVLGLVVGLLTVWLSRYDNIGFLLEFLASFISVFLSRSIQSFLPATVCYNFIKISFASYAIFLPGLSLTIAIIELSTRNMVSGTIRLFGAIFCAMMIGFGLTIGSALVLWDNNGLTHPKCAPTSPMWAFVFFIPMAMSINIQFQGNRNQWFIMTVASALGFVTNSMLNLIPVLQAQPTAVTALSAMAIGLASNVYARVTNDVAIAPILAGLLIQVPGSLSVTSTLQFFQNAGNGSSSGGVVDGVNFTFQMLLISMSLAMGELLFVI
ncbi:hypothetical protein BC830DRAFT_1163831 [Chytriomyces sp. MP71]|nr:hypothetical protein BC830DRAFT_1163831 [Chytriomyces sp. MP71]